LKFTDYWVYVVGPLLGTVIVVGIAYVLRGSGGGESGPGAAQGDLFSEASKPGQA
jgi:aquaporin Z